MNTKKLLLIPALILSSAILLTGCTSNNNAAEPTPSVTAADTNQVVPGYVAPPQEMAENYKAYYFDLMTTNESMWSYFDLIGATSYKQDPTPRSTTVDEWVAAEADSNDSQKFDKMYGDVASDVEQTALNVSSYLEQNPTATIEEVKNKKDLIVNRYESVGSTSVEQDPTTGHFFSVFTVNEAKGAGYGILVPQTGKTPDFAAAK